MRVKLKHKKIIYLNLLFLILFSNFSFLNSIKFGIFKDEDEGSISLRNSGYWNVTGTPIFINGSASGVGAHNWTWAESQEWSSGSGTWNDPYIIENIRIDANNTGSGIEVRNSNVYFLIKNVTIFNSSDYLSEKIWISNNSYYIIVDWHAGIKFFNVNNSMIIENNLSFNYGNGISLENCFNNSILNNSVINNSKNGLDLSESHFTEIYKNNFSFNIHSGISLSSGHNNSIIENILNFNKYSALNLYVGQDNNISKNVMKRSGIRIYGYSLQLLLYYNSIDSTNKLNGKPIYYFSNTNGLTSLNFTNAGQIILVNCSDSIITGLNLTYGSMGLSLYYCENITIIQNNFSYNSLFGIFSKESSNISISKNVFNNISGYGIDVFRGTYNKIFNNIVNETNIGIEISSNQYINISGNIHIKNNIGLRISQSDYALVYNNSVSYSRSGIYIHGLENSTLLRNIIYNNEWGIRAESGINNKILENVISNNNETGISLWHSINYTLVGNNFTNCGLDLEGSQVQISSYNISITNLINGKPLYYYVNKTSLTKINFTDAGQIILINSSDSVISDENISSTTTGISLFYCKNITVFNVTASYNLKYGIGIVESEIISLINNTYNANLIGIQIFSSINANISENVIDSNMQYGIKIDRLIYSKIANNRINQAEYGIYLSESNNSEILNNQINNNLFGSAFVRNYHINLSGNLMINSGILTNGDTAQLSTYTIDTTNKVNGKPVYYYVDRSNLNKTHFINPGQIILVNCSNSIISNVSVSYTPIGLNLFYSNNISILDSNFSENYGGALITLSNNITIYRNKINNNSAVGLMLQSIVNNSIISNNITNNSGEYGGLTLMFSSNNNLISENTLKNNTYGVQLSQSSYNIIKDNYFQENQIYGIFLDNYEIPFSESNLIYHNYFNRNLIENAYDNGMNNRWDNGAIGNYWDDYDGEDLNNDRIGDTPYYISGSAGSSDKFPLLDFPHINIEIPQIIIEKPSIPTLFITTSSPTTLLNISLEWTTSRGADNYTLYRYSSEINSSNLNSTTEIKTITGNNTSDTVSGIGRWYYAVVATNVSGSSDPSNSPHIDVQSPSSAPGLPTLTITTSSPTFSFDILLTWTTSTSADNYTLYRHTSQITSSNLNSVTEVKTITGTSTTDTVSGVGRWYYAVIATNEVGSSDPSNSPYIDVQDESTEPGGGEIPGYPLVFLVLFSLIGIILIIHKKFDKINNAQLIK